LRVVFGGREQHGVGAGDRLPETGDGRRGVPDVVVLVVGRDRLEAVEDLELGAVLLDELAGRPEQQRVMRVAAQAPADAQHPH
jgi:hypothetical protein